MTTRRLIALVKGLPAGGALDLSLNGPPPDLTLTDRLLAEVVDSMRFLAWVTVAVNTRRSQRPPMPEPVLGRARVHDERSLAARLLDQKRRREVTRGE